MSAAPVQSRGFSLIEVLVALVVFAIGLLGVASLQLRGQQVELEAYQRAQALVLLEDMVNRLNTNRTAGDCYPNVIAVMDPQFVGTGAAAPPPCAGVGTTATRARADEDLAAWDDMLKGATETRGGANVGTMTGARGCITVDAAGVYTVSVAWQGDIETEAVPSNTCADDAYGAAEMRRVVSTTVAFADLD